jgi:hypothetical protein
VLSPHDVEQHFDNVDKNQTLSKGDADPIAEILSAAGFNEVDENSFSKLEETLRRLASLIDGVDEIRRATVREAAIKKLEDLNVSAPARLVDATLIRNKNESALQRKTIEITDPEPWPELINGARLLDDIAQCLRRFVALPPYADSVEALWAVHAHALDAFGISPVLEITSPELECGKSVIKA